MRFLAVAMVCGVLFSAADALAQCQYDLNGVGYPASCGYRGPSGNNNTNRNPTYDNGAAQSAQAATERKRQSAALDQQGLDAERRGDLKEAAARFMEAQELAPDSTEIRAHIYRVNAELADRGNASDIRVLRQRLEDSIQAAGIRAQRQQLEEKLAHRQARGAIASADCIFDGRAGCTEPVALVRISADQPPVPPDAARFIATIPKMASAVPAVQRDINLYLHMASVRGRLQNQMIADRAKVKANPNDKSASLKLMEDSGHLKVAQADERGVKDRLTMDIDLIQQGPAADASGGKQGAAPSSAATKK